MRKDKKLVFILGTSAVLFFLAVNFMRHNYVVPILMYHSVDIKPAPKNRLAVSVTSFERQMRFLKKHRYNVIFLEALGDLIRDNKKVPARTLVITFDDGYKNNYDYAFPVLKKYNLAATVFVIIDEIGRYDRLTWDQIRQMQGSGVVAFGSHSLGPQPLVDIKTDEELKRQIFDSKKILGERLGGESTTFSYPEGRFNPKIREMVIAAGYKAAVTTSPGKKFPSGDVFALKRLRISSTSDNLFVFWIEISGIYTFIKEHRDDD